MNLRSSGVEPPNIPLPRITRKSRKLPNMSTSSHVDDPADMDPPNNRVGSPRGDVSPRVQRRPLDDDRRNIDYVDPNLNRHNDPPACYVRKNFNVFGR